jgi:hypothetical protein
MRLWRNDGESMTDIALENGVLVIGETRGVVVFDYDRDGDQDFYVVNHNRRPSLLENRSTDPGHWLRVRLQGTHSNRDAVGAIIRLTTPDGRVQTRELGRNSNYNSHNEPIEHFGLGDATGVAVLEIEWPASGWVQRFTDLAVDQEISIVEAEPVTSPTTPPVRGMYWDRSRSGHGFEFQRSGDTWFILFYTYRPDNTPLWYLATGAIDDGVFTGTAYQFDYETGRSPPQQIIGGTGGPITIDFNARDEEGNHACNDGVDRSSALNTALFEFNLDGQSGQWCVEPFIYANGDADPDFTGSWYNSEDPGWGLTIGTQGSGEDTTLMAVLYFYDAESQPRWALGAAVSVDLNSEIEVEMRQYQGFCLECQPGGVDSSAVGSLRFGLTAPDRDPNAGNTAAIEVDFLGAPGGGWFRSETAIQLLSDSVP